jgi:NADPH-dependent 2,4-dienoyl-CoA reductase/sulfur reductase-like enzyme
MARERLVVIGGDAAGMSAASQARRRRDPDDLEILAVERGRHTSYSACGIPYWVGGEVHDLDSLVVRTPEAFRAKQQIEVLLCTEAVGLDLDRGEVTVRVDDEERQIGYDRLMLGLGAVPVRPDLPGLDAAGVYGVQTLDDGEAVRAAVDAGAHRAVVVGGGYVGLEMAEAMVRRGLLVTLVDQGDQVMSTVDSDMAALVGDAMVGLGIQVRLGEAVRGVETGPEGRVRRVVTAAGGYDADLVVLGLGVRPNTALAGEAGLPLGESRGVSTDRRMQVVGQPNVWAAGDCVETFHRILRRPVHLPLGTHANKQGRVAGINIGGGYAAFPGAIGTAATKVCALEIARTGLTEREAAGAGFEYEAVTVGSTTRAGYYPGAQPITVKVLAERGSGRLLGGQIVGQECAAKRIDVLATAAWNGMTVQELAGLDLSYAPPFAPVWDPVLIAARKAAERLG